METYLVEDLIKDKKIINNLNFIKKVFLFNGNNCIAKQDSNSCKVVIFYMDVLTYLYNKKNIDIENILRSFVKVKNPVIKEIKGENGKKDIEINTQTSSSDKFRSLIDCFEELQKKENISSYRFEIEKDADAKADSADGAPIDSSVEPAEEQSGESQDKPAEEMDGNSADQPGESQNKPAETDQKEYWKNHWKNHWAEFKRNRIVFGAPGTGKSFKLNNDKETLLKGYKTAEHFERVTFHPDYSFANFVGVYKPVPDNNGSKDITYKYIPGPFMRIYVKAKQNPDKPYLLLIEEINRANTAAVFGDIFQLLDRKASEGYESEYSISASEDMENYFNEADENYSFEHDSVSIPGNLFIWATMNSADQGVFPMDTAFKRRWNFEYVGIDEGDDKVECASFKVNNETICWNDLRKAINDYLADNLKLNEDKLLGPFFVEFFDNWTKVDPDDIKYKVLMYLFEDAARQNRTKIFEGCGNRFSKVIDEFDKNGIEVFHKNIVDKYRKKHPNTAGSNNPASAQSVSQPGSAASVAVANDSATPGNADSADSNGNNDAQVGSGEDE